MSGVSRTNRKASSVAISRVRPATGIALERAALVLSVLLFILSVAFVRMMMATEPIARGFDARQSGVAETATTFADS
jgi:hypothetical protein